jgi:hypothetical protein
MTMVQEGAQQSGAKGGNDSTLADLRKSVTAISEELATIAERRTRVLRQGAEAGTTEVRRAIRRQPVIAMGVAAVAGALLALAVVPRFGATRTPRSRFDGMMSYMPQVTRADLHDMADSIQRQVSRAASSVPFSSSVERLVDAISKVEPTSSMNSAVEKLGSWLSRVPDAVKPPKK